MAKALLTCRVCGKRYEACRTPNPRSIFRWQDVACSRECGAEYLAELQGLKKESDARKADTDDPT